MGGAEEAGKEVKEQKRKRKISQILKSYFGMSRQKGARFIHQVHHFLKT